MRAKKPAETPASEPLSATVTLTVNLRPAIGVGELEALQERAAAEGVSIEALIVRGITQLLDRSQTPAAA